MRKFTPPNSTLEQLETNLFSVSDDHPSPIHNQRPKESGIGVHFTHTLQYLSTKRANSTFRLTRSVISKDQQRTYLLVHLIIPSVHYLRTPIDPLKIDQHCQSFV